MLIEGVFSRRGDGVERYRRQYGARPRRSFLDARRMRGGATAIMVDLGRSWCPEAVSAFDACFTDDMEQSGALAGNNPAFQAMAFAGDLPGLVTGGSGRCDDHSRIAFLFPGVALADIAAGACLLARAVAAGVGDRPD